MYGHAQTCTCKRTHEHIHTQVYMDTQAIDTHVKGYVNIYTAINTHIQYITHTNTGKHTNRYGYVRMHTDIDIDTYTHRHGHRYTHTFSLNYFLLQEVIK